MKHQISHRISNSPRLNRWAFRLLSIFLGAIMPLGFAPFNQWYLVLISLIGWHLLFDEATPKEAFRRGWWYGLGLFTSGICWVYVSIHTYGYAPHWMATTATLLLTSFLALFFAFQAYVYNKFQFKSLPILGFSALWVFFEWIRLWLFTGFPWLYIGYAFIDTPLAGYAPIGSVFLMSLVACISSECLYLLGKYYNNCLRGKASISSILKDRNIQYIIGGIIAIWTFGFLLSTINWSHKNETAAYKVSVIQGNIHQKDKWKEENRERTKAMYRALSLKEWENYKPDIILWPEAAIPMLYEDAKDYFQELAEISVKHESTLISGLLYTDSSTSPPATHNGAFSFNKTIQSYAKQRLVPFGEYIPLIKELSDIFPFLKHFPQVGVSPGSPDQQGLTIQGYLFSPSICYEVLYPNIVQKYGRNAGVLFTISNDAWFGRSHGPPQHFQMARMRAIELDRYMIRGTNNGITAIVDSKGNVTDQLETDTQAVLRGEVIPAEGMTPFGFWGILPIIAFSSAICFWAVIRRIFK